MPEMIERAEIGGDRHDGHEEGKEDEFVEDGAVGASAVAAACMYSRLHVHRHLACIRYPVGHCLWRGV